MNFIRYWQQNFSEILPFCADLKFYYPEKWFRIHSLPESKRYADTNEEYQIILERQNQLFDTVFGVGADIIIVFSLCTYDVTNDNYAKVIDFNDYKKLETISLSQREPENYEDNVYLELYVKNDKWQKNKVNKILKAIADDEIRMLLICPKKNRVITPYDGGVDVIMENKSARNQMKITFKDWLSHRKDGL